MPGSKPRFFFPGGEVEILYVSVENSMVAMYQLEHLASNIKF